MPTRCTERKPEIRIHVRGAVIHSQFTSSAISLRSALRQRRFDLKRTVRCRRDIHGPQMKICRYESSGACVAIGALLVVAVPTERAQAPALQPRRCDRGPGECQADDHRRALAPRLAPSPWLAPPSPLASPPPSSPPPPPLVGAAAFLAHRLKTGPRAWPVFVSATKQV